MSRAVPRKLVTTAATSIVRGTVYSRVMRIPEVFGDSFDLNALKLPFVIGGMSTSRTAAMNLTPVCMSCGSNVSWTRLVSGIQSTAGTDRWGCHCEKCGNSDHTFAVEIGLQ
jgi:hypothetical protein